MDRRQSARLRRSILATLGVCLFCFTFAPVARANVAPVVDGFTASPPSVAPGGAVALSLLAHDPDCPGTCTTGCGQVIRADLVSWSANGGTLFAIDKGVTSSPYTTTAHWQAPQIEGVFRVSVYLADSGTLTCGGRQTNTPTIDITVSAITGQPPVIQSLTASPVQLFPGGESRLACAAGDPDGDSVTYSWQSDAGTITSTGPDTALFHAGGAPGIASVSCTATDPSGLSGSRSIALSITGAMAEKTLGGGFGTPQRLAVDSVGDLYVVDPGVGGVTVVNMASEELVYRIPLAGATSVAMDWGDNLLLGGGFGAEVRNRRGEQMMTLELPGAFGEVSDVAVDRTRHLYGVLHHSSGLITVYDVNGTLAAAFGSTGDGPEQLKSPLGLAAAPNGEWVVADTSHGMIKVFNGSGAMVRSFGGLGGGAGEFVQLTDVAVDGAGVVFATDSFQSWVQAFNPDGSLRETIGTYGDQLGQLRTPMGLEAIDGGGRLVVASSNASHIEIFRTSSDPILTAPAPLAALAPAFLVFAPQAVGTTGISQTVTLQNTGSAPLGVRRVAVDPGFDQQNDCGMFLDPGGACTFAVRFAPSVSGPIQGSMVIDTSAAGPAFTVVLSGDGFLPPQPTFSLAALHFGQQGIRTVSDPAFVTLTNTGGAALFIGSLIVTQHYLQSNNCGGLLASGATCTIQISFAPQDAGDPIPGSLVLQSNAAGSPHSVSLDGRAVLLHPDLVVRDWTAPEGDTGVSLAGFELVLSFPATDPVTVNYTTVAGTAAEDEDYEATSGTLVFQPGQTSTTVSVPVFGDTILEPPDETFDLDLSAAAGARITRGSAVGTIQDDELCSSPNLLRNPSAEEDSGGPGIMGWTVVSGDWRSQGAPPTPSDGQRYFFSGAGDVGELVQVVDIAAYARGVDLDQQSFVFEASLRSANETPADTARVRVEYLDRQTQAELDAFDSGEVASVTAWQRLVDVRKAPPGTGWIRVRLIGTRYTGSSNDAYFDGLSLHSIRAPAVVVDDFADYEGNLGVKDALFNLRLTCPYWQPIDVDFDTRDATALAGEDYLPVSGTATLPAGSTIVQVPVGIVGDRLDEDHEFFNLALALGGPPDAVLLDSMVTGTIVNDDFCPRSRGWWRRAPSGLWPVTTLPIGGVVYDATGLAFLLEHHRSDAATLLAAEVVAARLNLERGSDPRITPTVVEADALLEQFPPGSNPAGADRDRIMELRGALSRYNHSCNSGRRRGSPRVQDQQ